MNKCTIDISRCSARQHSHLGTSVNKQHAEDPMYTMLSSKVTFNYVVPEIIRPLDSYARDYARMAALVDCDPNFSIYRKLRWLHYRVLLHLQAELARLELDLQVIDNKQAERRRFEEQTDLWCDTGDMTRRKKLLAEIKTKLAEYDDLVFRPEKKNAMMRPTRTNQISAMHSACQSLALMEAKWIFRSDDLVAPGDDAAEQSWLNTVVYYARMLAPRLFRAICQSRERRITPPPAYPSTRHAEWTPFIAQSSR